MSRTDEDLANLLIDLGEYRDVSNIDINEAVSVSNVGHIDSKFFFRKKPVKLTLLYWITSQCLKNIQRPKFLSKAMVV